MKWKSYKINQIQNSPKHEEGTHSSGDDLATYSPHNSLQCIYVEWDIPITVHRLDK